MFILNYADDDDDVDDDNDCNNVTDMSESLRTLFPRVRLLTKMSMSLPRSM